MRVTQGCFSFLPDLTDEQISRQVQYCLGKGWAVNIEFTDDPHPRNNFWEMWGLPMFDLRDAAGVLMELSECRKVYSDRYIRLSAFDSSHGWESVRPLSLIGPRTSPASGSTAMRSPAATSAIPRNRMPSIVPKARVTVANEFARECAGCDVGCR
jgi:ribulose-bisphosphate carboxylase small chain